VCKVVVDELAMAVFKACFAVRGAFGGGGDETKLIVLLRLCCDLMN